jgi:uncharacterized glyoxalase superfamily protein PhnB
MPNAPVIYPSLSYRDAPAAIRWLHDAFGFETLMEVPNPDGTIAHAEMCLGEGVIMLGSERPDMGWSSPLGLPAVSQTIYVAIDNPDEHHARAKAAGAEIVLEPQDTDYGSRDYGAKDLEGHYWYFGTYRPAAKG